MWNKLPDWIKFGAIVVAISTPAQIIDAYKPELVIPTFLGAGLIAIGITTSVVVRRFRKDYE